LVQFHSLIDALRAERNDLLSTLKKLLKDSERVKEVMLSEIGIGMHDEIGLQAAREAVAQAGGKPS
jgi:hypothetical protein